MPQTNTCPKPTHGTGGNNAASTAVTLGIIELSFSDMLFFEENAAEAAAWGAALAELKNPFQQSQVHRGIQCQEEVMLSG